MNDYKHNTAPLTGFLGPRYWPTWLAYGVIWALAQLPFAWQASIGKGIGLISHALARRRRHICEVNIGLCFPELTEQQQRHLVRETFISNGIGVMEVGMAWCRNPKDFAGRISITGLDNLQQAHAQGRGVLLISPHFSTMEVCGSLMARLYPIRATYRRHKNPLFESLMTRGRQRHFKAVIERKQVRRAFRQLKDGHVLWYAPDQDYGRRHSVFVKFFGVTAATITGTSAFANANNSPVVFLAHYRKPDNSGYQLIYSEPLENYPSGDDHADAQRINDLIEEAIRRHPEQYIWLHRRFKTRPPGMPNVYEPDEHGQQQQGRPE